MTAFTLLIPTRNRFPLLFNQLQHYSRLFRDKPSLLVPVVIADSSDQEDSIWNSEFSAWHGEVIRYRRDIGIIEKLSQALGAVRTPFVVIGADDDVFDLEGLHQAAAFLERNPEYSSCSGQIVTAEPNGAIAHYPQRNIEAEEPLDRIADHLSRYTSKWYSMQRTAHAARNYALTLAAKLPPPHLDELLPSCLSVMAGKSKVLDSFYMVRRVWPDRPKPMSKEELIARPEWPKELESFRNAINHYQKPLLPLTINPAIALLDLWLYAPKRSRLRCAWDNWRAQKWKARAQELLA